MLFLLGFLCHPALLSGPVHLQKKGPFKCKLETCSLFSSGCQSAVSGYRGLWVALIRTAETRVTQVGRCPFTASGWWDAAFEASALACPGT